MVRRALVVLLILSLGPQAATAGPRASHYRVPLMTWSWSWLRAPFAWLASSEPKAPRVCEGPLCRDLTAQIGWRTLELEVNDHGQGLYADLSGSVQFRSAEIFYADGDVDRLDLQYAIRTDGIFELRDFGRDRTVTRVNLLVRRASSQATLAIRLGRPVP